MTATASLYEVQKSLFCERKKTADEKNKRMKAWTHDASLRATLRHEVARNVADDGHTVKLLRVMLQK